jgi:cell envelope opacity-associated protein A
MADQIQETTSVSEVDLNLDEILGTPGAENIMLPSTEEAKPNMFSSKPVDTSFLDKPDTDQENEKKIPTEQASKQLDEIVNDVDDTDDDEPKTTGRPRVTKEGVVELTNKLIEKGLIMPFDEDKPLDKYTLQDFEELIEANFQEREKKIREQTPAEFFDALPEELQYAAKYVADGGQDLKGLFRTLAAVEEVKSLDPTDEMDQENIVRSYLHATNFGSSEDIEEEIEGWKDRGELEAKANKFKPKLDVMQEQMMAQQLAQQEQMRKQQEAQARQYMNNVYETLEPGEINGVKLDKKTQAMLYAGLVQPAYPSISGRNTNLLGHLLEKYQYVEPNHGLIAEALWLLADPDGYKAKIKDSAKKETTEKHVRMLKTEQANKLASTGQGDNDVDTPKPAKRNAIPRPAQGFFKR